MGFALIWSEGLAVALLSLALALAWATRGGGARALWVGIISLVFFGAAAVIVLGTFEVHTRHGNLVRTTWFYYSLTWLVAFTVLGVFLLRRGLRRPQAGLARSALTWPRGKLWLGFGGAVLAFGLTFWNMDLAARADLAVARQEAGALLLTMTPPPVAESQNAARVYTEAVKDLGEPIRNPWQDAAYRGIDAREHADWKNPSVVELVKKQEGSLALLRKAAAMPGCNFDHQRSLLDAVTPSGPESRKLRRGVTLLALDARVQATQGNLTRAFQDITAIFGMVRHLSGQLGLGWGMEVMAWRTLEDVLRLAPPGKEPLPLLAIPELLPLVREVRGEQALLGMVLCAAASQPSPVIEQVRQQDGPLAALVLEAAVMPTRVFLIPDELAAMRKLFEDYRKAPRWPQDETPKDWADLRKSVATDPTSFYGIIYSKPKHQVLLAEGSALAALRQTGRTGLAAAAYRRKHGRFPGRLEQLVPEFLPALPVDPRDGQALRLQRLPDMIVVYAPQDSAAVASGQGRHPEDRWPPPIFRLYASTPRAIP
jgi:hypothetical protein